VQNRLWDNCSVGRLGASANRTIGGIEAHLLAEVAESTCEKDRDDVSGKADELGKQVGNG